MRPKIFVDTCFWIALFDRKDELHKKALMAKDEVKDCLWISHQGVLMEFLSFMKKYELRESAIKLVYVILEDPNIQVKPITNEYFRKGLARYSKRLDKEYSLIDCISMNIADRMKIKKNLTCDKHFAQEGFDILMK